MEKEVVEHKRKVKQRSSGVWIIKCLDQSDLSTSSLGYGLSRPSPFTITKSKKATSAACLETLERSFLILNSQYLFSTNFSVSFWFAFNSPLVENRGSVSGLSHICLPQQSLSLRLFPSPAFLPRCPSSYSLMKQPNLMPLHIHLFSQIFHINVILMLLVFIYIFTFKDWVFSLNPLDSIIREQKVRKDVYQEKNQQVRLLGLHHVCHGLNFKTSC